nr:hypothetical protein [Tanacetum cinerariifolium]
MATTIDQQVALDEALVPSMQRLRIGRSNFRLPSDIQSKESTLQVVYDVLRNSPFFRAFQVTADVPEIYMQEFWATAKLHHNSIHFKMNTKKSVFDLEAFREMLHISPRIPSQSFAELPFEEEILKFLCFRLSQAQILWGFYHRSNVDYAYLIWEDFVYQVEHKNQKRRNEMYYPRFTKVIIDYFMRRKPSISRRNRINWYYVRDDVLFSIIKVVSRHQTTQQYDAILPIELTTDEIKNSMAYKEYYACATGEAAPKPKASSRKKKGDSASSTTLPTPTPTTTVVSAPQPARAITPTESTDIERTEAEQLKIVLKRSRQETHISQQRGFGTDKGTGSRPGVMDVPSDDSKEELSWNSSDDEDEYYACTTGEAAPKPKASAKKKKGDSASSTTPPTPTTTTIVVSALRLSTTAKGTDEGISSRPGVSDVPSDDSEEELSWNSFDDEEGDEQTQCREESKGDKSDESNDGSDDDDDETVKAGTESDKDDDDNDDEEELTKKDDEETESGKGGDEGSESERESDDEETRQEEEESFDPIPRTPDGSEDESNDEEDQELRLRSQSRQLSASESAFAEEPMQTTCQIEEPPHPVFETGTVRLTRSTMLVQRERQHQNQKRAPKRRKGGDEVSESERESDDEETRQEEEESFYPIPRTPDGSEDESNDEEDQELRLSKEARIQEEEEADELIEESVNATLEAEVLTRSSHFSITSYAIAADLSEMELKKILIEKMEGNKSIQQSDEQQNLEHASASTPSETATEEEPVQTTCQMEEPPHPVFETGADDQPMVQTSQHPEWFSQPRRPPSPDRSWNKTLPAAQGDA